jgi:CxxC-x17-CxxC domain-containing protein
MSNDNRGFGGPSGPREMHDAVCGDCGQKTQVPFKPTAGRPVYCRDCFAKRSPPRGGGGGGFRR